MNPATEKPQSPAVGIKGRHHSLVGVRSLGVRGAFALIVIATVNGYGKWHVNNNSFGKIGERETTYSEVSDIFDLLDTSSEYGTPSSSVHYGAFGDITVKYDRVGKVVAKSKSSMIRRKRKKRP
jgi:hypothetical protein